VSTPAVHAVAPDALRPLPTGVLTFCMSDIEGSTHLWEHDPAAMLDALGRHGERIAEAIEAHGGRLLRWMGEGDSTVSVFTSPTDAVSAAIAAVAALDEEPPVNGQPIRTRFGLHTGTAEIRDEVYVGTTLNLTARIRNEASGQEILLSEMTAALVQQRLPRGYTIVALGQHQLKGIERPQPIRALAGPGLATTPSANACPYRGLRAFEAADRHLFFGREDAEADVLRRITAGRLLAVVGPSGSGKSSLLRAGVVAAVQAGELSEIASAHVITPTSTAALQRTTRGDDPAELLVVDQFEELYTQCRDPEYRRVFIDALLRRHGPTVIGVRADFYGELSADAGLAAAVARNQVLLGPMREDDLRRAIAEPATRAGLRLQAGLIDLVLRDVAGEPGALPLMSHALRETWERRDGRMLTVAAYHASGGVSEAIARTADAAVKRTPQHERPVLRNIFLRLTELGDDVEDARRRVRIEELIELGDAPDSVRRLLERLNRARLVTLDNGTAEVAHEVLIRRWPTLRRWLEEDREGIRLHRRLTQAVRLWDASRREPADLYRGTRLDAAAEWASRPDNNALLTQTERDFLAAGVEESASTQRRQLQANRRLRRALIGGAVLLLAAVGLLVVALSSRRDAVDANASARSQAIASEADSQLGRDPQRALLLARAALGIAPTAKALLAVSEALDANTARSELRSFGVQGCQEANFLFLFDHGRTAADNTCDGHIVFADLVHRRIVDRVRVGTTSTGMVLSRDGRALIIAAGHNLISLDVATKRTTRIFTAPFPIEQLAGAPGRSYAIADKSTVAIVDLAHRSVRTVAHGDPSANVINGLEWASRDVLLVASLGQSQGRGDLFGGLTVVNVATRRLHALALGTDRHPAAVNFLRISPDRRTWFITGTDTGAQAAATWAVDAATERTRWVALGPLGATASPVRVSSDNRLVAVGYSQGATDVLDARTGRLVVRNASSAGIGAGDMAFGPGDRALVTVALDGVIRTWAAHGGEQLRVDAPGDPAVDFTPDGENLVLIGTHGKVVDRRTGRVVRRFPSLPAGNAFNTCATACFAASPQLRWLTYLDTHRAGFTIRELDGRTGRIVASADVKRLDAQGVAPDGRIIAAYVNGDRLSANVIDPRARRVTGLPSSASSDGCAATTPSFTPDSRLMAIVDGCIHVTVWDLRRSVIKRMIVLPDRASGSPALLTPDGRYVLVTALGGALVRIDLSTGRAVVRPGAQTEGKALAISPDGRFYAIGRQDGTVDVYDALSLELVRHHTLVNAIQTLAFSPNSSALAVEDTQNVVRVFDTCAACESPARLAQLAARASVRALTPGERATFGVS
jgi:class 3 adenylate cyclase/WD40 repeat protein/energy-coupling factor transporter ATP-binding protein EcfA2